jgi:hypothetical protein
MFQLLSGSADQFGATAGVRVQDIRAFAFVSENQIILPVLERNAATGCRSDNFDFSALYSAKRFPNDEMNAQLCVCATTELLHLSDVPNKRNFMIVVAWSLRAKTETGLCRWHQDRNRQDDNTNGRTSVNLTPTLLRKFRRYLRSRLLILRCRHRRLHCRTHVPPNL